MNDKENELIANYPRLAEMLYNTPLLLQPEKAALIESIFQAIMKGELKPGEIYNDQSEITSLDPRIRLHNIHDYQMLAVKEGFTSEKPFLLTEGGTGIIPIVGTLVHRAGWLDAMSGMLSYGRIANRIKAAAEHRDVKGILLEMDSPGGSAAGLFELADTIKKVNASKPVWASVNESAFSAGYAISAAAKRITGPKTSSTGSIGTVVMHVDQSEFNTKRGVKVTYIMAGKHKADFSPHQALSDDAAQRLQAIVNQVNDSFIEHVANARNLAPVAVRNTEAQIFTIQEAIDLGLADAVNTLDETVTELEGTYAKPGSVTSFNSMRSSRTIKQEDSNMNLIKLITAAGMTAEQQQQIAQALADLGFNCEIGNEAAYLQANLTEALVREQAPGIAAQLEQAGAKVERERIEGIFSLPPRGQQELLKKLMFDGTTSKAEAALQLVQAEEDAIKRVDNNLDSDAEQLSTVEHADTQQQDNEQGAEQSSQPGQFNEEQARTEYKNSAKLQREFLTEADYIGWARAKSSGNAKILGQK